MAQDGDGIFGIEGFDIEDAILAGTIVGVASEELADEAAEEKRLSRKTVDETLEMFEEFEARERAVKGKKLHHISERGSSDGKVKRMKRPFERFVADHIAGRKGLFDDP